MFCGALPHAPQGNCVPLTPCWRRERRSFKPTTLSLGVPRTRGWFVVSRLSRLEKEGVEDLDDAAAFEGGEAHIFEALCETFFDAFIVHGGFLDAGDGDRPIAFDLEEDFDLPLDFRVFDEFFFVAVSDAAAVVVDHATDDLFVERTEDKGRTRQDIKASFTFAFGVVLAPSTFSITVRVGSESSDAPST